MVLWERVLELSAGTSSKDFGPRLPTTLRISTPSAAVGSSFPRAPPRPPVPEMLPDSISSSSSPWDHLRATLSLSSHRCLRPPPPWLLPPSVSPWAVVFTVLWFCNIWPLLLSSPSWMLPPSVPLWSLCPPVLTSLLPAPFQPFSNSSTSSKDSPLHSLLSFPVFHYGTSHVVIRAPAAALKKLRRLSQSAALKSLSWYFDATRDSHKASAPPLVGQNF
ncbi:Caveolin-3 [Labeo rohita]|uniref:Caveolin-3 n=1 Tax=Labeo rohita TaxID=84645 RepID=A0ABQ8LKM8_LABRO|nr:Caveolin-3 [Labeo rohita]